MIKGPTAEWGICSRTVFLKYVPVVLTCWRDTIAVGLTSSYIIILNMITGSQTAVFPGHTDTVWALTFSLDGTLLVSGSRDETVKLWDVQTGGVIKTFHVYTKSITSVSISPDCTMIASGCKDGTIHLWDIQTGGCFHVIDGHNDNVNSVNFSPTNSQLLISASDDYTVRQWDVNGHQIGPTCEGTNVAFSPDGTHFVLWRGVVATVQNSHSGAVVIRLQVPSGRFQCCCFSPNGKLIAGSVNYTIHVWDISSQHPHLIKTLNGHAGNISSLNFSSSLVSASEDYTVKFWQINTLSSGPVEADMMSTSLTSVPIKSVSLQVREGLVISSDLYGCVKTWDISTGLCKASFKTQAGVNSTLRDVQLVDGRLVIVLYEGQKISIWDIEEDKLIQRLDIPGVISLRISGDGSKLFCSARNLIQAWSLWTGEVVGKVELVGNIHLDPLYMDGSKIWVFSKDILTQGWDFGIPDSPPIPLSSTPPNRPRLELIDGTKWWSPGPNKVKDTVTGEEVFQLSGRYAEPAQVQWDGQYLVAGYGFGEVLILGFNDMLPQ